MDPQIMDQISSADMRKVELYGGGNAALFAYSRNLPGGRPRLAPGTKTTVRKMTKAERKRMRR